MSVCVCVHVCVCVCVCDTAPWQPKILLFIPGPGRVVLP